MKLFRAVKFLAAAGFVILAVVSACIAQKEVFIVSQAPAWSASAIVELNEDLHSAYSTQADYAVMDACLRVARSAESLVSPRVVRAKLAQSCRSLAESIVKTSPQNAYSWFALAYFAQILAQMDIVSQALVQSYLAGPNEQWIAEQRVLLAETILPELSSEAQAGHIRDLALLVQSRRGIGAIAQRYVNNPRFRARITDIVERLPLDDQRRFLTRLRQEIGGE